jgi:hypothetical protein
MIPLVARALPHLKKAWPLVQKAGNFMVPGGAPTPAALGGNLAMSIAPNLLFAGMSAASLPDGTGAMDRGLVAGEQFLGSTALEFGAQALAGAGLRMAGSRLGPGMQNAIRGGVAMGVPALAWGSMPQPTAQRVWGDYNEQMTQQIAQENTKREQELIMAAREQAFAEMAGFGPMQQAYAGMYPGGFG